MKSYVNWKEKHGGWVDIRGTEIDVSFIKGQYILKGKIDLIKGKGDTVEIVDFKAIPKPNQYAEKHLKDRFTRQLEIYAWLVKQRHGLEVSAMNIYYTGEENGSPVYNFPYKPATVDKTIAEVDRVIGRMERKEFQVCERPAKLCKRCDLQPYCDRQ